MSTWFGGRSATRYTAVRTSGCALAICRPIAFAIAQTSCCDEVDADRNVDVNALAACRLDERLHADAAQHVADDQCAFTYDRERRSGNRVEIEVHVERAVGIVAERVPRVEIDAAEIDHPQQRGAVVDDGKIDDVTRAVLDRARANPRRPRRRRPLHVEEVAGNAVRISLHHHRPVRDVRQQHARDSQGSNGASRPS